MHKQILALVLLFGMSTHDVKGGEHVIQNIGMLGGIGATGALLGYALHKRWTQIGHGLLCEGLQAQVTLDRVAAATRPGVNNESPDFYSRLATDREQIDEVNNSLRDELEALKNDTWKFCLAGTCWAVLVAANLFLRI